MAYFPNGTSGMVFEEEYCDKCMNRRDLKDGRGPGCPIWDIHMLFNYDQHKETDEGKRTKEILEILIPTKDLWADECSMFQKTAA